MPTVSLTAQVPCAPAHMWRAVVSPVGFRFVSRGLVHWPVVATRTTRWLEGEAVEGWMFFFGFVPVARHRLRFVKLDDDSRTFQTDERGGIISSWQHTITVTPDGDRGSRVHDTVTFSGGIFTPALWILVKLFYAIRAPRWVGLARAVDSGDLKL
jgi:hypothetical protein